MLGEEPIRFIPAAQLPEERRKEEAAKAASGEKEGEEPAPPPRNFEYVEPWSSTIYEHVTQEEQKRKKQESGLCMVKYLLDSSAVIDVLRYDSVTNQNMQTALKNRNTLSISSHVYYEVVRGFKGDTDTKKFRTFVKLYQSWEILPFDMRAANKAVEIYLQLLKVRKLK